MAEKTGMELQAKWRYIFTCQKCGYEHQYVINIGKRYKCKQCKHTEYTVRPWGTDPIEVKPFDGWYRKYVCKCGNSHIFRVELDKQGICNKCGYTMTMICTKEESWNV